MADFLPSTSSSLGSGTSAKTRKRTRRRRKKRQQKDVLARIHAIVSAKQTGDETSTAIKDAELLSKLSKREGQLTYAQLAVLGRPFLSSGGFAINKGGVVCTRPGHRPSITARGVLLHVGLWYFEVSVITPGRAVVGWGDALYRGSSDAARGVGDCAHSWGLDGHDMQLRHTPANKEEKDAVGNCGSWASGDVIGCYVNISNDETATMSFYRNGHSLGLGFHSVHFTRGLTPVVSFDRQFTFVLNFGTSPFRSFVPNRARSVHHWARQKVGQCFGMMCFVVMCLFPRSAFADGDGAPQEVRRLLRTAQGDERRRQRCGEARRLLYHPGRLPFRDTVWSSVGEARLVAFALPFEAHTLVAIARRRKASGITKSKSSKAQASASSVGRTWTSLVRRGGGVASAMTCTPGAGTGLEC